MTEAAMADDGRGTRDTGPGDGDADPLLVRPFLGGRAPQDDTPAPGEGTPDAAPTWPAPAGPEANPVDETVRLEPAVNPVAPAQRRGDGERKPAGADATAHGGAAGGGATAHGGAAHGGATALGGADPVGRGRRRGREVRGGVRRRRLHPRIARWGAFPRTGRRRALVLAGVGAVLLLALGAAGLAAILPGDDGRRALPIPDGPLPPLPTATYTTPPPVTTPATPAGDTPAATTAATPSRTTSPAPTSRAPRRSPATTRPTTATSPTVEAPLAAPRTGPITGPGGRCLDLDGGQAADGKPVQMYDCNNSTAQRWTVTSAGTLEVLGKCANIAGDNTVHVVACDGRTTAQWRTGRDGTLVNIAGEQCLTDPAAGLRNGSAVRVALCIGGPAQEWSLP